MPNRRRHPALPSAAAAVSAIVDDTGVYEGAHWRRSLDYPASHPRVGAGQYATRGTRAIVPLCPRHSGTEVNILAY